MTADSAPPTAPPATAPRRDWLWRVSQALFQVFCTVWLRYRACGTERLPAVGGGLVLSNHQSFLDPMLIAVPLTRPISFLARDTLFAVPVVGWFLRRTHVMPLNREGGGSTAAIRAALKRMDDGFLVGLFPEGTRSADGKLGSLKPGFASLVRRTTLPIFPVGIAGANQALGRGSRFIKPRRVCVVFGEPFPPDEIARLSERGREEELVAAVRSRIAACQAEAEARVSQWSR
jgi:1-acyl-sn-glycerol-3-phosphate acyltransferase